VATAETEPLDVAVVAVVVAPLEEQVVPGVLVSWWWDSYNEI
jgi:hypothetical protein